MVTAGQACQFHPCHTTTALKQRSGSARKSLNQYTLAGSAAFCHDANGNLTADGASVYLYDIENRLVEKRAQGAGNSNCAALAYTGALQAELRYDPTGRLYQVTGGTLGIQRFAYDGNAMIAEYNSAGAMLRRYVHGSNVDADDPLIVYEGAAVSDAARRYLHADPRGSIVAVTNNQGTAIATYSYDEYGIPDSASGTDIATKGRFRYTGQAWLPELGMYYYKARIYSPTLGRFLQTDPIGYEDQFNLYAYVANDPVNGTDPTGEDEYELSLGGTLVFGAGGDLEISVSFDSENLEMAVAAEGSMRVGLDIGVAIGVDSAKSDGSSAQNNVSGEYGVDAKGSIPPATVKADLLKVTVDEGKETVSGVLSPNGASERPDAAVNVPVRDPVSTKVGDRVRAGISVGLAGRVEGTTKLISDGVRFAKDLWKRVTE